MSSQKPNGHSPRMKDVTLESVDPVDMFLAGILSLLRVIRDSDLTHMQRHGVAMAAELITRVLERMDESTTQAWNLGMVEILLDATEGEHVGKAPGQEGEPGRNGK